MVLSCKADLPHEVDPHEAVEMLKRYDTGLIEVSSTTDPGKERMNQLFQCLLTAVFNQRGELVACFSTLYRPYLICLKY